MSTLVPQIAITTALQCSPAEFRTVRRVLECPVPSRRRRGHGHGLVFDTDAMLTWLAAILPRLDPANEHSIRAASIHADTNLRVAA